MLRHLSRLRDEKHKGKTAYFHADANARREPASANTALPLRPCQEKANQEDPQIFLICIYKNIFPLMMAQRTRAILNLQPFTSSKRLPHITGDTACPVRTPGLRRPAHRLATPASNGSCRLPRSHRHGCVLASVSADGAGCRHRDEPHCQLCQQAEHLVHILVCHDADQKNELAPGKYTLRLCTVAWFRGVVVAGSSRNRRNCAAQSNRPGQLTVSKLSGFAFGTSSHGCASPAEFTAAAAFRGW